MTTSAHKPTAGPAFSARALQIAMSDDYLGIQLEDGRRIEVPLAWFPRLAQASAEQRKNWRLIGRGVGIHWPDLDEDISVENLLATRGEDVLTYRDSPEPSGAEPPKTMTRRRPRGRSRQNEELIVRNARGQFVKAAGKQYSSGSVLHEKMTNAIDTVIPRNIEPESM